jgi:hypothetical protein
MKILKLLQAFDRGSRLCLGFVVILCTHCIICNAFGGEQESQGENRSCCAGQNGSCCARGSVMNDDMAMMGAPGLVPFGIMTGEAGRWMLGYEFMLDEMNGSRVGTEEISDTQILKQFPAAPTDMTMQMHMAMLMYAPTDTLTLSAMVPYVWKEMNNITATSGRFVERTDGIGDVELKGSYCAYHSKDSLHRLLLNGGVGLPTGSTDATMDGMRMEYCMQVGSGTFSILPGFTYIGQAVPWGWGADFNAIVRLGRNGNGYRLGNGYTASTWIARQLASWVSLSVGLRGDVWENVHGADPTLDPTFEQTMDPNLQGGKRLNAFFGINLSPCCDRFLRNQQFFVRGDLPMVQSLDGPQLQTSWTIRVAWQWTF